MAKKKILIIDDDVSLCDELSEILSGEGYSVNAASDTENAQRFIRKNSYDLYILDYKMQGMTGIDLLKIIKEQRSACPVLLITGRPAIESLLEAENLSGAVAGILNKPFNIEELLYKIRNLS